MPDKFAATQIENFTVVTATLSCRIDPVRCDWSKTYTKTTTLKEINSDADAHCCSASTPTPISTHLQAQRVDTDPATLQARIDHLFTLWPARSSGRQSL